MRRSKFSLSHYRLATMDMGKLIPLTWYEALPGDSIRQATSALIRVSPLLSPVMHPVRVRLHHWFVPYRLIWTDWEDFITGGPDGTFTATPPFHKVQVPAEGSLYDHFGVPPADYGVGTELEFSALPTRAYNLIYNEAYRDQDLVTELTIDKTDGQDTTSDTDIQKIAWEKDYFTTARPWETKGAAVSIPIGTEAPIYGKDMEFDDVGDDANWAQVRNSAGTLKMLGTGGAAGDPLYGLSSGSGTRELVADLTSATGTDINDLRLALAIQRYQEARAQYGSRYVEYLRYLGVRSSDSRLARPEYLGGGRQVIQFSEILQTGQDFDANTGVGTLRGHGIAALRSNRFKRYIEEHGLVMTLMSVVPKAIYAGGLHKSFSRQTKEEFYQRELETIGEQAVLNKELYAEHATRDGTFGYQRRYDDYRWLPSNIAGEFRSTLNHWHYARLFASDPALNQSFVEAVPTTRVYASAATDPLYVMANHSIQARRIVQMNVRAKTF